MQKRVLVVVALALLVVLGVTAFAAAPKSSSSHEVAVAPAAQPAVGSPAAAPAVTPEAVAPSDESIPQDVLDLARKVKGKVRRPDAARVTPPPCPVDSSCGTPNHCAEGTCGAHTDTGISECRLQNGQDIACIEGATIFTWTCSCHTTCSPVPCLCANNASHWACEGGGGGE